MPTCSATAIARLPKTSKLYCGIALLATRLAGAWVMTQEGDAGPGSRLHSGSHGSERHTVQCRRCPSAPSPNQWLNST